MIEKVISDIKKEKLTVADLKKMKPETIFAKGWGYIEHPWFNDAKPVSEGGNLEPDGRSVKVKWVAFRGGIADWKIYHSLDANLERGLYLGSNDHLNASWNTILLHGAGLHKREEIRKLVPCTDEALELYRD